MPAFASPLLKAADEATMIVQRSSRSTTAPRLRRTLHLLQTRFVGGSAAAQSQPEEPSAEQTFRVSEMFASIQGEGPHAGRPSVFLRLGHCNLSCAWCDTPYTWLFREDRLEKVRKSIEAASGVAYDNGIRLYDKEAELRKMSAHAVLGAVETLASPAVRAVVITGGEPLLHAKPLLHLVPEFQHRGYAVEVETNGTVSPAAMPDGVHFNVSPKLANSRQPASARLNFPVLRELMTRGSSVLKFVVDQAEDLVEVNSIVERLSLSPHRVYLMPQGRTSDELKRRGAWVADACRQHGFHYTHRIHVELWGDKRGV